MSQTPAQMRYTNQMTSQPVGMGLANAASAAVGAGLAKF